MNKKVLATLCAVATTLATVAPALPVMADEIGGSAVYLDKAIYKVTLPTTAKQAFILDPEGLVGGIKDGAIDAETLAAAAGTIVTDKDGMKAVNSGSMPVALETKLKITGDAAVGTATDATKTAKEATVYFEAAFSDGKADGGSPATLPDAATKLTDESQTVDCILPAAKYTFALADGVDATAEGFDATDISNYVYKMTADTESGAIIKLTGACAKDADWSAYVGEGATKKVGLEIVFKFYKTKDKAEGDTTQVKDDTKLVGPSASVDSSLKITMTGLTADKNYKSMAIKGSVKTEVVTPADKDITWGADAWSAEAGGTLVATLSSAYATYYAGNTVTVTITLSDDSTITATVAIP